VHFFWVVCLWKSFSFFHTEQVGVKAIKQSLVYNFAIPTWLCARFQCPPNQWSFHWRLRNGPILFRWGWNGWAGDIFQSIRKILNVISRKCSECVGLTTTYNRNSDFYTTLDVSACQRMELCGSLMMVIHFFHSEQINKLQLKQSVYLFARGLFQIFYLLWWISHSIQVWCRPTFPIPLI
jgi:hypothetical protein